MYGVGGSFTSEPVANELVDWFNAVDATYRSDLRELNELNFARFDAKVEQRLAGLEARLDAKIDQTGARLDARIDRLATALEGKLDSQVAAHGFAQIDARFDAIESRFDASLQKGLRQQMGWMSLMWVTLLAALIART